VHARDFLLHCSGIVFFVGITLAHFLVKLIFLRILATSIHASTCELFFFLRSHVKVFSIFERLVAPSTFLKRDHPVDIRLLELLDVVKLLAYFILTILRLRDEVAEDLFREVGAVGLVTIVHLVELLVQLGPLLESALVLGAHCGRSKLIFGDGLRVA